MYVTLNQECLLAYRSVPRFAISRRSLLCIASLIFAMLCFVCHLCALCCFEWRCCVAFCVDSFRHLVLVALCLLRLLYLGLLDLCWLFVFRVVLFRFVLLCLAVC